MIQSYCFKKFNLNESSGLNRVNDYNLDKQWFYIKGSEMIVVICKVLLNNMFIIKRVIKYLISLYSSFYYILLLINFLFLFFFTTNFVPILIKKLTLKIHFLKFRNQWIYEYGILNQIEPIDETSWRYFNDCRGGGACH